MASAFLNLFSNLTETFFSFLSFLLGFASPSDGSFLSEGDFCLLPTNPRSLLLPFSFFRAVDV